MNLFKKTKDHTKYWKERKIDWKKDYLDSWNHPHRFFLTEILKNFSWLSLLEIGCGGGANLANIVKGIEGRQIAGIDVNPEAIELARSTFNGGLFRVNSADDIMMSDKSVDVVLSDMTLIYVSPKDIDRYLTEIKRITRNRVVFCEFHSTNWFSRLKLRFTSGYNSYDYKKLLRKHGFYDIISYRLTEELWPGGNPQKTFGYVIVAKLPNNKR